MGWHCVVTTHAGARVEAPLTGLDTGSVGVLLSVYQDAGELGMWTEMLAGSSVRDACRAFGFDDINWVDDRTRWAECPYLRGWRHASESWVSGAGRCRS